MNTAVQKHVGTQAKVVPTAAAIILKRAHDGSVLLGLIYPHKAEEADEANLSVPQVRLSPGATPQLCLYGYFISLFTHPGRDILGGKQTACGQDIHIINHEPYTHQTRAGEFRQYQWALAWLPDNAEFLPSQKGDRASWWRIESLPLAVQQMHDRKGQMFKEAIRLMIVQYQNQFSLRELSSFTDFLSR